MGRPDFIPREVFRIPLTRAKLDKLFRIGGMLPSSFVLRCKARGRPLPQFCNSEGRHAWRPIDLVARASADAINVRPCAAEQTAADLESLRHERLRLEAELSLLRSELEASKQSFALERVAIRLTSRALHREADIVAAAVHQGHRESGVYFLVNGGRVVYVGQSASVYARVQAHAAAGRQFDSFAYVPCPRKDLDVLESLYIHTLQPAWNGEVRAVEGARKLAPMRIDQLLLAARGAR